jgi:glycosyltransferase involved in cell wall biosynthesis
MFDPVGPYAEEQQPYRECGVILMTTTQGMGVQIKSIEALACGRAIVARRGAMRGIPPGDGAWMEVDTPEQMVEEAGRLVRDAAARESLGRCAHDYYERHLNSERIRADMARVLTELAAHGASKRSG